MTTLADLQETLDLLLEEKGVRRVRTPAGARRYRLPIGSPIEADVPDLAKRLARAKVERTPNVPRSVSLPRSSDSAAKSKGIRRQAQAIRAAKEAEKRQVNTLPRSSSSEAIRMNMRLTGADGKSRGRMDDVIKRGKRKNLLPEEVAKKLFDYQESNSDIAQDLRGRVDDPYSRQVGEKFQKLSGHTVVEPWRTSHGERKSQLAWKAREAQRRSNEARGPGAAQSAQRTADNARAELRDLDSLKDDTERETYEKYRAEGRDHESALRFVGEPLPESSDSGGTSKRVKKRDLSTWPIGHREAFRTRDGDELPVTRTGKNSFQVQDNAHASPLRGLTATQVQNILRIDGVRGVSRGTLSPEESSDSGRKPKRRSIENWVDDDDDGIARAQEQVRQIVEGDGPSRARAGKRKRRSVEDGFDYDLPEFSDSSDKPKRDQIIDLLNEFDDAYRRHDLENEDDEIPEPDFERAEKIARKLRRLGFGDKDIERYDESAYGGPEGADGPGGFVDEWLKSQEARKASKNQEQAFRSHFKRGQKYQLKRPVEWRLGSKDQGYSWLTYDPATHRPKLTYKGRTKDGWLRFAVSGGGGEVRLGGGIEDFERVKSSASSETGGLPTSSEAGGKRSKWEGSGVGIVPGAPVRLLKATGTGKRRTPGRVVSDNGDGTVEVQFEGRPHPETVKAKYLRLRQGVTSAEKQAEGEERQRNAAALRRRADRAVVGEQNAEDLRIELADVRRRLEGEGFTPESLDQEELGRVLRENARLRRAAKRNPTPIPVVSDEDDEDDENFVSSWVPFEVTLTLPNGQTITISEALAKELRTAPKQPLRQELPDSSESADDSRPEPGVAGLWGQRYGRQARTNREKIERRMKRDARKLKAAQRAARRQTREGEAARAIRDALRERNLNKKTYAVDTEEV